MVAGMLLPRWSTAVVRGGVGSLQSDGYVVVRSVVDLAVVALEER
jgi:hypothetical protein